VETTDHGGDQGHAVDMKTLSVVAAAAAIGFAPFSVIAAAPASAAPCGSATHPDVGLATSAACHACINTNHSMTGCMDDAPMTLHYPDCEGLEPIAASNCLDKHVLDGDPGVPGWVLALVALVRR
jgi:hypothetical protein